MTKKGDRDAPAKRVYRVHTSYNFAVNDGDDKPIAHVEVFERMAGLWVTNLWVKEDLRGQGLGRTLMNRLIAVLGDQDLYLSVHPYAGDTLTNEDLIAFYMNFGFAMSAVRGIMFRRGKHG